MNRYGLAVLAAALASIVALGSSALAQAPQPAGPAPAQAPGQAPRPPAAAPAQPPRVGAAPAPSTAAEVRRSPGYRACVQAAKRRGLRGAKRRSFVTRCRIGRESITR